MTNCPCCSASYDTGSDSLAGCSAWLGSGAPAHRQMKGTVKAPGLARTNISVFTSSQIIGCFYLLKCISVQTGSHSSSHFFTDGFMFSRDSCDFCLVLAAVIPFPLICISASACSLSVGEQGKTYLNTEPFGVPASSVTATSQAKQTGCGALTRSQRHTLDEKAPQAATDCTSTSLLI